MKDNIILKLEQSLIDKDFNANEFFEDFTVEEIDLIKEQLSPFSKVLLNEALKPLTEDERTSQAAGIIGGLLQKQSQDESDLDKYLADFEKNKRELTEGGFNVIGTIVLSYKAGYGIQKHGKYSRHFDRFILREPIYKFLIMVEHKDVTYTFTYNLNEDVLAYTIDGGAVRYIQTSVIGITSALLTVLYTRNSALE